MRGSTKIVLVLLLLLLLATGFWWLGQGGSGMTPLEGWCATQLRRIAGDLLEPTLDFSTLELELPATLTLNDVSLTSDGVAIVTMTSMRLELRDPPKRAHPLVIKKATFQGPEVRLIGRADGTLQGFDGFVKSTTGGRHEDGGSSQPSDFLAIREISIHDGMLEWAPHGSEHPMRLDHLGMDLTTKPDAGRPGWYAFKANIERPPVVQLTWDGGISIDTGDLAFDDVTLDVDLSQDHYASLTPSIQDQLRRYSIVGKLTLHVTGHVPLADTQGTDLTFNASLQDAGAAFGDYHIPVDSADMKATFRQMQFAYDPLSAKAFGGQVDATGSMGFAGAEAFALKLHATDVFIEKMIPPAPGEKTRFAGKVGLEVDLNGEGRDVTGTMQGNGTITIADGELIGVPALRALAGVMGTGTDQGGRDRGELEFTLLGDRARIDKGVIQSITLAAHGTGDVHYDGRLDMTVNAGVIEKAEALLFGLGDLLAHLTDHLLPYRISGTWSSPTVEPAPLGIGGERHDGK